MTIDGQAATQDLPEPPLRFATGECPHCGKKVHITINDPNVTFVFHSSQHPGQGFILNGLSTAMQQVVNFAQALFLDADECVPYTDSQTFNPLFDV